VDRSEALPRSPLLELPFPPRLVARLPLIAADFVDDGELDLVARASILHVWQDASPPTTERADVPRGRRARLERGVRLFVSDIEVASEAMKTPAYENFARLGFTVPYRCTHWMVP
jgi:hypothetical protein